MTRRLFTLAALLSLALCLAIRFLERGAIQQALPVWDNGRP